MALLFKLSLHVLYLTDGGIARLRMDFATPETSSTSSIRLYLAMDGFLDTVYSKSYIKSAGLCQSLILDVFTHLFI